MTPDARERILKTPLKAVGNFVHVAAASYHVATVSRGMNDPEDYAKLFADAPMMLVLLHTAFGLLGSEADNYLPMSRKFFGEVDALLKRHGMED